MTSPLNVRPGWLQIKDIATLIYGMIAAVSGDDWADWDDLDFTTHDAIQLTFLLSGRLASLPDSPTTYLNLDASKNHISQPRRI